MGTPTSRDQSKPLADIVHRNIKALLEVRQEFERRRTIQDRIADVITSFTGSMWFVILHAVIFGVWILINTGVIAGVRVFDPFPFVMLAMVASVEAIFLSTFVLISQNRMAKLADQRAELDLQISLLSEHEITRVIQMVDRLCQHIGCDVTFDDVQELAQDVNPETVLKEIEKAEDQNRGYAG